MALLLKTMPRFSLNLRRNSSNAFAIIKLVGRAPLCMAADSLLPRPSKNGEKTASTENVVAKNFAKEQPTRADDPDYRRWKIREAEILKDIEPIIFLTKEILHSKRYMDGECLSVEDEKEVVEKLLAHHPHSEDKIGSGLDSIMVDRHPQFKNSRCLFVVRTDGGWIDFSYQKCLCAYVRNKYPSSAERFIKEHFKRGN